MSPIPIHIPSQSQENLGIFRFHDIQLVLFVYIYQIRTLALNCSREFTLDEQLNSFVLSERHLTHLVYLTIGPAWILSHLKKLLVLTLGSKPRAPVHALQTSAVLRLSNLEKQPTFRDVTTGFPWNEVWETSAEMLYWWPVTTQIWVVLLIG